MSRFKIVETAAQFKRTITFNPALIDEMAERLCTHYTHAFREACVNAYDEDATRVDIYIEPSQIIVEDHGKGIDDVGQFLDTGSPYKKTVVESPRFKRKVIGSKGVGKLSLLKLGKRVDVYSNNGSAGHYFGIRIDSLDVNHTEYKHPQDALHHQGTRFTIRDLKRSADPKEMTEYFSKTLALLLSDNYRVFVNDVEVSQRYRRTVNVSVRTNLGQISGYLEAKGHQIAMLCKNLYVTTKIIYPERLASGWVNADFLVPSTARDDFVQDNPEWKEFHDQLRSYIASKFPRKTEAAKKSFRKLLRKITSQLGQAVRELGLPVEGSMPKSKRTKDEKVDYGVEAMLKTPKEKESEEKTAPHEKRPPPIRMSSKLLEKAIGRPLRTDFGVVIVEAELGEDVRPTLAVPPNQIAINLSNSLTKLLYEKKQFDAIPLLTRLIAEAYVELVGKASDRAEFLRLTDAITLSTLSRLE